MFEAGLCEAQEAFRTGISDVVPNLTNHRNMQEASNIFHVIFRRDKSAPEGINVTHNKIGILS